MSKYHITLEGKTYEMEVDLISESAVPQSATKKEYKEFESASNDPTVRVIDPSAQKQTVNHTGAVTAPIPGTVIKTEKAVGDTVKNGELVLVLEAMKMENEILATSDGIIKTMNCEIGSTVAGGEILFEIE